MAKKTGTPEVKVAPPYQLERAAPEERASERFCTPAGESVAVPRMEGLLGPRKPRAGVVRAAVEASASKVKAAELMAVWRLPARSVALEMRM